MLIEIHIIQNHSPANLNRDDLGAPKTCLFGGVTRGRISSQCIKRSIRNPANPYNVHNLNGSLFAEAMQEHMGKRTRLFPWRVEEALKRQDDLGIAQSMMIPPADWSAVVSRCALIGRRKGKEEKGQEVQGKQDLRPRTAQLIFLGPRDASEFVKKLAILRSSQKASYDYFLDPQVSFKTLLEDQLQEAGFDEEKRKKTLKNGWLIFNYTHRFKQLKQWALEHSVPGVEEYFESEGINTPGQKEAKFLAQSLDEMWGLSEKDQATRSLLEDLLKARVTGGNGWRGSKEHKIGDERKKPNDYEVLENELSKATGCMGVDIALFGRMTTSDFFEDVEASMQVAHAISTHEVVNEVDYFTAVDDFGKAGGGAAHVGEGMFNSACYYKYFCLDWDQLVHNLAWPEPDSEKDKKSHEKWEKEVRPSAEKLAAFALGHLLKAAALTRPSGKQNSFAAHNEPCGILVEIKRTKIPVSYANAFAEPVRRVGFPDDDAPDENSIEGRSISCLADHIHAIRTSYGIESDLLWYSPKLWRYPLQYWERTMDGKKVEAKLVTENCFQLLGDGVCGGGGFIEEVIRTIGFDWSAIKDSINVTAKETQE